MPLTVIPYQYPDQLIDVYWPQVTAMGSGSAFQVNGNDRYALGNVYAVWSGSTGAATNNMGVFGGILCGQFTSGGAATVERAAIGFSTFLPLTAPVGASAAASWPEQCRCFGVTCMLANAGGSNLTDESGFVIEPASAASPGWIKGNFGFGLVGDGAGGWRYVEKNAGGVGVYQFSAPVAWPVAINQLARVDYVMFGATMTQPAHMELWVNNVLKISRTWGVGSFLPDYTTPANAARFVPHLRCGEAGLVSQINIAVMRFQGGQFHPVTGQAIAG